GAATGACASAPWPSGSDRASASATASGRARDFGIADSGRSDFEATDGTRSGQGCQGPAVTGRRTPGGSMSGPWTTPARSAYRLMIRLFGRKKPDSETAGDERGKAGPGERRSGYSIEELAAAFPGAAPAQAEPEPVPAQPAPAPEPAPAAPPAAPPLQASDGAAAQPAGSASAPPVAKDAPPAPTPRAPRAAPVQPQPAIDPAPAVDAASAAPAAAGRSGWRERLRGSVFARSVGGLFSRNPKLDDDLLDEIETALLTADVGVSATTELVEGLRRRMKAREFADAKALLAALRGDLVAMLQPIARPLQIDPQARPFVVLTVGVNGVGKTTTIGKLARRFRDEGRSLMLAAGDTFRAAAVAQLQAWGERNGVAVIAQG